MALAAASVAVQAGHRLPAPVRVAVARPLACWGVAAVLYVGLARVVPNSAVLSGGILYQTPGRGLVLHVGFAVIALLIVAPAVFPAPDRLPARVMALGWLAWLGLISYGIYLWHDPLLGKLLSAGALTWWPHHGFAVLTAATLAAALVAAALSYQLLERPVLALKDRRRAGTKRRSDSAGRSTT
jgi:peptidoglycan/LPS O-acetylase OafA/YrhL